MSKYEKIKSEFENHADRERAAGMKKYMRDQFEFYGIPAMERKKIYHNFLKEEKRGKIVDWDFLDACYQDSHREFQYLAVEYLSALGRFLSVDDIPKIRRYVLTKSWWDTIDVLCKVIGTIADQYQDVKRIMLDWSQDENLWIRRTAIEYQLGKKDKMNTDTLEKILTNIFGSHEFFINKAIGWALRDYSKTNPAWVTDFIERHEGKMSRLSIREGSKYL